MEGLERGLVLANKGVIVLGYAPGLLCSTRESEVGE